MFAACWRGTTAPAPAAPEPAPIRVRDARDPQDVLADLERLLDWPSAQTAFTELITGNVVEVDFATSVVRTLQPPIALEAADRWMPKPGFAITCALGAPRAFHCTSWTGTDWIVLDYCQTRSSFRLSRVLLNGRARKQLPPNIASPQC